MRVRKDWLVAVAFGVGIACALVEIIALFWQGRGGTP